jgi:hypothetical protein
MDVMTVVLAGALLAAFTAIQTWINKGRFDSIDRRFEAIDRRFEQVAGEIAALRSDLTQIALAVGARIRPETG